MRLAAAQNQAAEGVTLKTVKEVVSKVEALLGQLDTAQAGHLYEVGAALGELVDRAGYTTRPALTEVCAQYMNLSTNQQQPKPEQVKLLAARTYTLLASELETNQFRL